MIRSLLLVVLLARVAHAEGPWSVVISSMSHIEGASPCINNGLCMNWKASPMWNASYNGEQSTVDFTDKNSAQDFVDALNQAHERRTGMRSAVIYDGNGTCEDHGMYTIESSSGTSGCADRPPKETFEFSDHHNHDPRPGYHTVGGDIPPPEPSKEWHHPLPDCHGGQCDPGIIAPINTPGVLNPCQNGACEEKK